MAKSKNKAKRKNKAIPSDFALENQTKNKAIPSELDLAGGLGTKNWVFLGAAITVLILSFLAFLGGISDGTVDVNNIFNNDPVQTYVMFRGITSGEYSDLSGYPLGVANLIFPDLLLVWLIYGLGANIVWGFYLWMVAALVISLGGWLLLCDSLFSPNRNRRILVILIHALPFIYMAWLDTDIFLIHAMPAFHYGTWVTVPWLLWLSVRILAESYNSKNRPYGFAVGLFVLLAAVTASDLVILPWFIAPAIVTVLWLYMLGANKKDDSDKQRFLLVVIGAGFLFGFLLGRVNIGNIEVSAHERISSGFSLQYLTYTIKNILIYLGWLGWRHPIAAIVWLAFMILIVLKMHFVLSNWRKPNFRSSLPKSFIALFVPLSIAATFSAVVISGNFTFPDVPSLYAAIEAGLSRAYITVRQWEHDYAGWIVRYIAPPIFFPLFTGWALLLPAKRNLLIATAATITVIAAPKAMTVEWKNLNMYSSPFFQCYRDAAKRLNWKAGIASTILSTQLATDSENPVKRVMPVGVAHGREQSFLYQDWTVGNRHWVKKPFNFVAINGHRGRVYDVTPGWPDRVCSANEWEKCFPSSHSALILDGAAARGAFGEPSEIIECDGMGFYHYDPPITVTHSQVAGEVFNDVGWNMPKDK